MEYTNTIINLTKNVIVVLIVLPTALAPGYGPWGCRYEFEGDL